jgi:hypothetical protein
MRADASEMRVVSPELLSLHLPGGEETIVEDAISDARSLAFQRHGQEHSGGDEMRIVSLHLCPCISRDTSLPQARMLFLENHLTTRDIEVNHYK